MEPKVRCDIRECIHNLDGAHCGAQSIEVMHNQSTNSLDTICNTYQRGYDGGDSVVLNANINYSGLATTSLGSTDISPIAKCQVTECKYHRSDGYCHASAIKITLEETSMCNTYEPQ